MAIKDTLAESVLKGFEALKSKRSAFDTWLQDITFYILPEYEAQEAGKKDEAGNFDRPVSSVATESAIKLGGNLYSYTYSQGDKNLVLRAQEGEESDEMKGWLEEASEAVIKAIQNSNFSEVYGEGCTQFGTFGTAPVATEWDEERGELLLRNHPINGEIYLIEDKDGRVDGLVRKIRYTAEQALEEYGDKLPNKIAQAANDPAKMAEMFDFIHMIRRNRRRDRNPKLDDVANMKYESIHVCVSEKRVVKKRGYRTFPFACPRFIKMRNYPNGYGAGHFVVNAVRELNKAESDFRDIIELAGKPPVFTPDEDSGGASIQPGRFVFVDMSRGGKPETYRSNADIGVLHQRIMQLSAQVERQFFLDVFMALSHYADQSKTLGEAQMIENEKLSSIGPMISRLRSEFWVPFVERVLDLLIENGRLAQPPGGKLDYKIVYTSRIDAQLAAINATESIRAINEAAQLLGLAQDSPDLPRVVKLTEAAQQLLEDRNLPQEFIVSDRERKAMDVADAQAAQAEQAQAMTQQLAGGMDPNKAPEDGSMMQQLNDSAPLPQAPTV